MMVHFPVADQIFNLRAAGISIHNKRVLLCYFEQIKIWSLPGGRCDLGEDSIAALKRECLEEMNVSVEVTGPAYVMENFFTINDKKYHEISIAHYMNLPQESEFLNMDEFEGVEGNRKLLFKWIEINKLNNYQIQPKALYRILPRTSRDFCHIINP
jgi:ADP-ribose pyrophosphatase YjhB (NUDIX family)